MTVQRGRLWTQTPKDQRQPRNETSLPPKKGSRKRKNDKVGESPQKKLLDQKPTLEERKMEPTEARRQNVQEDRQEVQLRDQEHQGSDVRIKSPEWKPAAKRREDYDGREVQPNKGRLDGNEDGDQQNSDSSLQGSTDSDGRLWEQSRMRDVDEPIPVNSLPLLEIADHLDADDTRILCGAVMGVDLTEVYSPERITRVCRRFQLVPGSLYDLTNGWNFSLASHRSKAMYEIKEQKHLVLIGSPPCTMLPMLQNLNLARYGDDPVWTNAYNKKAEEARERMRFCCRRYKMQPEAGRVWVHEHPWLARSWKLSEIKELSEDPRVCLVQAHQCRFCQKTTAMDGSKGMLAAKKPTGFLINSWCIAEELDKQCEGGHVHGWLMGGRAADAAKYPEGLCEAVCKGIQKQKTHVRLYGTQGLFLFGKQKTKQVSSTTVGTSWD